VTPETAIAELLWSRGAADIDHPGGTLYDHLARVKERLAGLGAPETVQLAGRAHAVYGTDGFAVPLLALDERPLLAALVGDEVEQLVYRYCACDRRESWGALADTGRIRDRFTGGGDVLDGLSFGTSPTSASSTSWTSPSTPRHSSMSTVRTSGA
jgi:hypothetical protein